VELTETETRLLLHGIGERLRRSPLSGDVGVYLKRGRLTVIYRGNQDPVAVVGAVTRMAHDTRKEAA
jgi:hypothetical protein